MGSNRKTLEFSVERGNNDLLFSFPCTQLPIHLFSETCFIPRAQVILTVVRPWQRQVDLWAPWPAGGALGHVSPAPGTCPVTESLDSGPEDQWVADLVKLSLWENSFKKKKAQPALWSGLKLSVPHNRWMPLGTFLGRCQYYPCYLSLCFLHWVKKNSLHSCILNTVISVFVF